MELTIKQQNELKSLVQTRSNLKGTIAKLEQGAPPKVLKLERHNLKQVETRIKELNPELDLDAPPAVAEPEV